VKRKIVAEERLKKLVDKEAEKIDLQNKVQDIFFCFFTFPSLKIIVFH